MHFTGNFFRFVLNAKIFAALCVIGVKINKNNTIFQFRYATAVSESIANRSAPTTKSSESARGHSAPRAIFALRLKKLFTESPTIAPSRE